MASVHIVGEISGAVSSVPVRQCRRAARAALPGVLCSELCADRGLLWWSARCVQRDVPANSFWRMSR